MSHNALLPYVCLYVMHFKKKILISLLLCRESLTHLLTDITLFCLRTIQIDMKRSLILVLVQTDNKTKG